MAVVYRSDFLDVDPIDICSAITAAFGPIDVAVHRLVDVVRVEAPSVSEVDLDTALDAFGATAVRGWDPNPYWDVPDAWQTHRAHLRDYRDAVRSGTADAWTAAEWRTNTSHVIADLIDALRFVNDRLTEDRA